MTHFQSGIYYVDRTIHFDPITNPIWTVRTMIDMAAAPWRIAQNRFRPPIIRLDP